MGRQCLREAVACPGHTVRGRGPGMERSVRVCLPTPGLGCLYKSLSGRVTQAATSNKYEMSVTYHKKSLSVTSQPSAGCSGQGVVGHCSTQSVWPPGSSHFVAPSKSLQFSSFSRGEVEKGRVENCVQVFISQASAPIS